MTRRRGSEIGDVGVLLARVLRVRVVLLGLELLRRLSLSLPLALVLEVLLTVLCLRLGRPSLIRLRLGLSFPPQLGLSLCLPLGCEGRGRVVGKGEVAARVELTRTDRSCRRTVGDGESFGGDGDGDALRGELVGGSGSGSLRGAGGDGENGRAREEDRRIAVKVGEDGVGVLCTKGNGSARGLGARERTRRTGVGRTERVDLVEKAVDESLELGDALEVLPSLLDGELANEGTASDGPALRTEKSQR